MPLAAFVAAHPDADRSILQRHHINGRRAANWWVVVITTPNVGGNEAYVRDVTTAILCKGKPQFAAVAAAAAIKSPADNGNSDIGAVLATARAVRKAVTP